jgi:predicted DNA-binding mobile mystery protein A
MKAKKLVRKQLDKSLRQFQALGRTSPPRRGWISAIRKALGMSARQLAARMGVSQQRVAQIEKQESDGGLTIKAMRKVAEGLDCRFVYGFIPTVSLEEMVTNQAKRLALGRLAQASHTMSLEDQALAKQENDDILTDMIAELTNDPQTNLWNEI